MQQQLNAAERQTGIFIHNCFAVTAKTRALSAAALVTKDFFSLIFQTKESLTLPMIYSLQIIYYGPCEIPAEVSSLSDADYRHPEAKSQKTTPPPLTPPLPFGLEPVSSQGDEGLEASPLQSAAQSHHFPLCNVEGGSVLKGDMNTYTLDVLPSQITVKCSERMETSNRSIDGWMATFLRDGRATF